MKRPVFNWVSPHPAPTGEGEGPVLLESSCAFPWQRSRLSERHVPGFTLIELLLVVVLLGLLSSVAVPRLNRSVRARESMLAADGFTTLVTTARAEAVRRGLKVRLTLDPAKGEYWLSLQRAEHSNREEFGPFEDGLLDARRTLPQGATVEGLNVPGRPGSELIFEPTGLAETRELRLVDASGSRTVIGIQEWYEQPTETAPP